MINEKKIRGQLWFGSKEYSDPFSSHDFIPQGSQIQKGIGGRRLKCWPKAANGLASSEESQNRDDFMELDNN